MLALLDYEAQQCGGCGGYLPETIENSYEATAPGRCNRCKSIKAQQKKYADQDPDSLVIWPVKKK